MTRSVIPSPSLLRHYSIRTEQAYIGWIKRYILFHGKRHPREMGASQVNAFLSHLAVEGQVSASTQNQALSALLFCCTARGCGCSSVCVCGEGY